MALEEIILHKKSLVAQNKARVKNYKDSLLPSTKSLINVLKQKKTSFIFEIKPSSPSKGIIRTNVNISEVAALYAPFASAISVLADEKYFGGSYAFVEQVSREQTCPILCKDVVVSPWQIYEARHFGADVVLLMLSVLDDDDYRACHKVATELNMDVITEVHTQQEMERAKKLGALIVGINNRNLKTLEIDLETSNYLAEKAPSDAFLISESGFETRHQLKNLSEKVDGFLVGTSLMRASRIDLALRELLFGRIKICGLTNATDAQHAYDLGAYYGGFNFSKLSKRCITKEEAQLIKHKIPLVWGGVFVNQPIDEVATIALELNLDFVQLHGDENEAYFMDLSKRLSPGCEIWQVQHIGSEREERPMKNAQRILLDSFNPSAYGGTGRAFDWQKLHELERKRYIIAGGINPNNILEVSAFEPFAIDIASGVEDKNPRQKSLAKMKDLFAKLWP